MTMRMRVKVSEKFNNILVVREPPHMDEQR